MSKITFKFEVDANGKFTYHQPVVEDPKPDYPWGTDWAYSHRDNLVFECLNRPFTLVTLTRTDTPGGPSHQKDPFSTPRVSNPAPHGVWQNKVQLIDDGLTDDERYQRWKVKTFVAKYRYKFQVTMPDGRIVTDDKHAGTHTC